MFFSLFVFSTYNILEEYIIDGVLGLPSYPQFQSSFIFYVQDIIIDNNFKNGFNQCFEILIRSIESSIGHKIIQI